MTRLIILLTLLLSFYKTTAQSLSAQDSSYLSRLHTELSTDSVQKKLIDSVYIDAAETLTSLDSTMKVLEKSDLSEEELNLKILDLNQQKKNTREIRDNSIQVLLNDAQRKIYLEKIKPTKPAVLHFGMNHDRANCNVCR